MHRQMAAVMVLEIKDGRHTAIRQREDEFKLASETAVRRDGRSTAGAGAADFWKAVVAPSGFAIGILLALGSGLLLLLNSQFKAQRELLLFQVEAIQGRLGELATKADGNELTRRLLGIEEHLRGGEGSGGQQE